MSQFRGAATVFVALAMVASCSSSDSKSSSTAAEATTAALTTSAPGSAGSTVSSAPPTLLESTSPQATSGGSASSTDTFDVTVSGSVSGQLQPGATGFITCYGDGAAKGPGFEAGISNTLSGAVYTLGVRFGAFSTAPVAFPPSQPFASGHEVVVQFSADADPTTKWVMADGFGSGTIQLAGGNGQPVTGTIDGDLAEVTSGETVHVTATFACTPA
ncbi:MAG: hypothetical protein JWN99_1602 [Ilumatobacteraceae bacterium]|jgi:hypothetical protein|nr:hypothetical protein [Ilumatobacteraceae bacterium]